LISDGNSRSLSRADRLAPPHPGIADRDQHLRGLGAPVNDVRASEVVPLAKGPLAEAVPRVLAALDPALGADTDVVTIVVDQSKEFSR
jgi:fructuronate reductase